MPAEPIAVLFSYDHVTGQCTADPIVGAAKDGTDPITLAHMLRESVEPDFPGRIWTVTGNDEARGLRKKALVEAVLGPATEEDR